MEPGARSSRRFGSSRSASSLRRVRTQMCRENFDCDLAPEPRILGAVHLAHPARPERRQDFVGAETGAGGERYPMRRTLYPVNAEI